MENLINYAQLEIDLMHDLHEIVTEKLWSVVRFYIDRALGLEDSEKLNQLVRDAVKNGHADTILRYTTALLFIMDYENHNMLRTAEVCFRLMSTEAWYSKEYNDERNKILREWSANMAKIMDENLRRIGK